MDSKDSFAKLLIEAFQEISEEQEEETKIRKKRSITRPKKSITAKMKKEFNDTANKRHFNKNKQRMNNIDNNSSNDDEDESDIDIDIENENENNNDNVSNLEDFVVSLLRFAPKQKLLISQLGLKITDMFDKSIKQISGLKSRDFFDKMRTNKKIKIKTEETENGALTFAHLIKGKNKKKNKKENKRLKYIESNTSNTSTDSNVSIAVNDKLNESKRKPIKHKQIKNDSVMNEAESDNDTITIDSAIEIVRNGILRLFLDGSREKIMLSAISAYCYKFTGIKWKEIMIQKPKEFVNDLVNDGLVILDKHYKNNSIYPFIKLNKKNKYIQTLTVDALDENMNKLRNKGKKTKKIKKRNENEEIIRNLIISKLNDNKCHKVFISTIPGIVLNHFEKSWKLVMSSTINEFVDKMVKDKLVNIDGDEDEQYVVIYDGDNDDDKRGKKRKLEINDEEIKEPKRKKHKSIKKESKKESNDDKIEVITLPIIKLNQQNGMEIAQKMIEKFRKLESKHDVHFHFQFDQ